MFTTQYLALEVVMKLNFLLAPKILIVMFRINARILMLAMLVIIFLINVDLFINEWLMEKGSFLFFQIELFISCILEGFGEVIDNCDGILI